MAITRPYTEGYHISTEKKTSDPLVLRSYKACSHILTQQMITSVLQHMIYGL